MRTTVSRSSIGIGSSPDAGQGGDYALTAVALQNKEGGKNLGWKRISLRENQEYRYHGPY